MRIVSTATAACALSLVLLFGARAQAQVGQGLADLNSMPEAQLAALPGMTPQIAKAFISQRPFNSIVEAHKFLLGQKLTPEQATAIYDKAFIHLNLNTATAEEIRLIPRAAGRMAREFEEYRPWKSFAQFDKEIGKYVDQNEVNRLKQYVFIPLDLNAATDEQFKTIPNVGANMIREFKEYRPWKTKAQFDKEIGKYVDAKEVARLWRYMVINPQ
jgi:DNA uptake protein ComE-like DNA-binding protein